MSIRKVVGIGLASAGAAGLLGSCASNSEFYPVNKESREIIEKLPNGKALYDSVKTNLPLGTAIGDPQRAVTLRDFGLRAECKTQIDSANEDFAKTLDVFMTSQMQTDKLLAARKRRELTDSLNSQFASTRQADSINFATKMDSTKTALIAKQKAELDSVINAGKRKVSSIVKQSKAKANADSIKIAAIEAKANAQRMIDSTRISADSVRIQRLTQGIKNLLLRSH